MDRIVKELNWGFMERCLSKDHLNELSLKGKVFSVEGDGERSTCSKFSRKVSRLMSKFTKVYGRRKLKI